MFMDISVQSENRVRHPVAGNQSTGILKVIALVFMFTDHAGKMCFPQIYEMRLIGRLAFPLYCWCMVVGFSHTRSVPKYILRVMITGIISQPLYMLALNHKWYQPNIFLTLLLGLCALWGIREKKWFSQLWAPAAALVLANVLNVDYGFKGVALILLLYASSSSRPALAAVMIAFSLFWGSSYSAVTSFFGISLKMQGWPGAITSIITPFLKVQSLCVLALPFILIRFKKDLRMPTWLGYALYPLHLILLFILEKVM